MRKFLLVGIFLMVNVGVAVAQDAQDNLSADNWGRCCEATQMRGGGQEQRRIMDNKRCAGGQRRENLANNRSARGRACKTLSITLFEDVGDDRVWLLTADQSRGRVELILSASRSA